MQFFKFLLVIIFASVVQFCLAQKVISSLSPSVNSKNPLMRKYVLNNTDVFVATSRNLCEIEILYTDGTDQNTEVLLNFNSENRGYIGLFELYHERLIIQTQTAIFTVNTIDRSVEKIFEADEIVSAGIYNSFLIVASDNYSNNEHHFFRINLDTNTNENFSFSSGENNFSFDREVCKNIYKGRFYYPFGKDLAEFNINTGEEKLILDGANLGDVGYQYDSLFFFRKNDLGFVKFNAVTKLLDTIFLGDNFRTPDAKFLFDKSHMALLKDSVVMRIDLLTNNIDTIEELNTDRYFIIGMIEDNIFYSVEGDLFFVNADNEKFPIDVNLSHIQSEFLAYQDSIYFHNGYYVYVLDESNNTFYNVDPDIQSDFVKFIGASESRFYIDYERGGQFNVASYEDGFTLLEVDDQPQTVLDQEYYILNDELWLQYYNQDNFKREMWKLEDGEFKIKFENVFESSEILTPQIFNDAFYYKRKLADNYYNYYKIDLGNSEKIQLELPDEDRNSFDIYFANGNLIFVGMESGKLYRCNADDTFDLLTDIEDFGFDQKQIMVFNDELFFINGDQLWVTDGTEQGTKNLFKFINSNSVENIFHVFNNELYFSYKTQFNSGKVAKFNYDARRIETLFNVGDNGPVLKNAGDEHLVLQSNKDFYYLDKDEFVLIHPANMSQTLDIDFFEGGGKNDLFFKGRDISDARDRLYRWNFTDNTIKSIFDYSSSRRKYFKNDIMYINQSYDPLAYVYDQDSLFSLKHHFDCDFALILLLGDDNIFFNAYKEGQGFELFSISDDNLEIDTIYDLWEGKKSSYPENFFEFDGEYYFDAVDAGSGRQIWSFKNGTVNIHELDEYVSLVNIYPNPTSEILTLNTNDENFNVAILYDVKGQELQRHTLKNTETLIDVSNLLGGIYFIQFRNTKNNTLSEVKRFVKID